MLGGLLKYFKTGNADKSYESALYYAAAISIATAISAITINQSIFGAFHIGGRIRVAVCSVVYRKVLNFNINIYVYLCMRIFNKSKSV